MWNAIKYSWIDQKLQRSVKKKYYHHHLFCELDQTLLTAYLFKSPYKISKQYLKDRNEKEIHVYGETPLQTYEKIAEKGGLQPKDVVLELGSGRGRGAFFIHSFFQCQVIGIERIPYFAKMSRYLSRKYCKKEVSFICADMLEVDFPKATFVYLYGTMLREQEIGILIEKLKKLPKGTKIVTISYPLTDYHPTAFCNDSCFPVEFLWGKTDAYLQRVG